MDFADQSGQPLAAQLGRGGRCALVLVVVLPCDAKDFAAAVNGCPGVDEAVDHRVEPFGRGLSSPKNLAACRTMDGSVSSSWIRRRAARSSADSLIGTPGRTPQSMSSCLSHFDSVIG